MASKSTGSFVTDAIWKPLDSSAPTKGIDEKILESRASLHRLKRSSGFLPETVARFLIQIMPAPDCRLFWSFETL